MIVDPIADFKSDNDTELNRKSLYMAIASYPQKLARFCSLKNCDNVLSIDFCCGLYSANGGREWLEGV